MNCETSEGKELNGQVGYKCFNCGYILTKAELKVVQWMPEPRCPKCYHNADIRPCNNSSSEDHCDQVAHLAEKIIDNTATIEKKLQRLKHKGPNGKPLTEVKE